MFFATCRAQFSSSTRGRGLAEVPSAGAGTRKLPRRPWPAHEDRGSDQVFALAGSRDVRRHTGDTLASASQIARMPHRLARPKEPDGDMARNCSAHGNRTHEARCPPESEHHAIAGVLWPAHPAEAPWHRSLGILPAVARSATRPLSAIAHPARRVLRQRRASRTQGRHAQSTTARSSIARRRHPRVGGGSRSAMWEVSR